MGSCKTDMEFEDKWFGMQLTDSTLMLFLSSFTARKRNSWVVHMRIGDA